MHVTGRLGDLQARVEQPSLMVENSVFTLVSTWCPCTIHYGEYAYFDQYLLTGVLIALPESEFLRCDCCDEEWEVWFKIMVSIVRIWSKTGQWLFLEQSLPVRPFNEECSIPLIDCMSLACSSITVSSGQTSARSLPMVCSLDFTSWCRRWVHKIANWFGVLLLFVVILCSAS